jgi:hypothetical protein
MVSGYAPTNIRVFYQIAQESIAAVRADLAANRRPKPNGEPGFIIRWDPDRKGFKTAFVAIVFSGIFIESALHILIAQRLGVGTAESEDRKTYEEKLELLGCTDADLVGRCMEYRNSRKAIVHEKAFLDDDTFCTAQDEAEKAIALVDLIVNRFSLVGSLI